MGVGGDAGRAISRLLRFPGRERDGGCWTPGAGSARGEKWLSWGFLQQDRSSHHVPGVILPSPCLSPAGP